MRKKFRFIFLASAVAGICAALSAAASAAPRYSASLLPDAFDYRDLNDRGDVLLGVVHHQEEWGPVVAPGIFSGGIVQVLPPIGDFASPFALNNRGEIAGYFSFGGGSREHAFVWTNGQYHEVPDEIAMFTDINDSGVAVGIKTLPGPEFWSLVFPENAAVDQDLGFLRGPFAINEAGHMAGMMTDDLQLPPRAFLYADRELTDLGTLGGGAEGRSVALALNDRDEVTGFSTTGAEASPDHAFLFSEGKLRDIGVLDGDSFSEGLDINNAGDVVGLSVGSPDDLPRAFLYSLGTLYDLSTLVVDLPRGVNLAEAIAINERGEVLATECEGEGQGCRGFLLTPLPQPLSEPPLPMLLVMGFFALRVSSRGRRACRIRA